MLTDPHLDWGIAVTVASVRALHHWLDSAARQRSMGIGRRGGILCATADMVIGECGGVAAGVGFFWHTVAMGRARCGRGPVGRGERAVQRFRTEHPTVLLLLRCFDNRI
ncbi:hypothetical protein MSAR_21180 [Mycolicibacterium sarraceniae]|uniref:Uncharacterized protein n=1 Tax=Mycolicibacterium sarraceniae TaxID=1534348 RepID=A0A7I7SPS4_9MYCO|nr:hypothetical protein MSAR_21180 [Mycolicibacterium sarraceniae]